jgi:hypothetical protein
VDDLIITGNNATEIAKFKKQMNAQFQMSDLGLLCFYLGIEVLQGRDSIKLKQTAYVEKILGRAGMANCNSCATPMEPRLKLMNVTALHRRWMSLSTGDLLAASGT